MANSHPGSYCGQDAYNDMLITSPQRERERVWAMETFHTIPMTVCPTLKQRDYKDPPIVFMPFVG